MSAAGNPLRPRTFRRDVVSWIVAMTLVTAAICALYAWQHTTTPRAVHDAAARGDDPRIVVLGYDRVVAAPDGEHVDAAQLRDHLVTLRAAGFVPVSLAELLAFYEHDAPLPPKSVVLMFDYGYLDIYRVVDPILDELRWPATVSLVTHRQAVKDTTFLYRDRLQRMVNSGRWDIAVHGHRAMDQIATADTTTSAPFINQRLWLQQAQRAETAEEYFERVAADVRTARRWVEDNVPGYVVRAFSYPYDSIGLRSADPDVRAAFERVLEDCCALAFSDDLFGVNGRADAPRRLRRLRVSGTWTAQDLAHHVTAALDAPAKPGLVAAQPRWVDASGHALDATRLNLKSGEHAWLAGSRWQDAWRLSAELIPQGGQFWLVQADGRPGSGWRVGGADTQLLVQVLEDGRPVRTLARYDVNIAAGAAQHIAVTRRGAGLWIDWNGAPVSELPVYLGDTPSGTLGWLSWSDAGDARLTVRAPQFEARPVRVATLGAQPDAETIQRLVRDARVIGALAVPATTPDGDLLRVLAHRYGWNLIPTVFAQTSLRPGDVAPLLDGFERIARARQVMIELDHLSADARHEFERAALPLLRVTLRRRGVDVLVNTPARHVAFSAPLDEELQ